MSESEVSLIQEGAGEDLVLLHGYLSCKESFYWQIKYFSKYFRVTAFDFWGFGKSPPLTEPWSVDDYAAHTLALLDELHIGRAHLLTHSFGGRVGLKLLAAHGERFLKAVVYGCAAFRPSAGSRTAQRFFPTAPCARSRPATPKNISVRRNTERFLPSCGKVIKRSSTKI